jgi:hypothetical protein
MAHEGGNGANFLALIEQGAGNGFWLFAAAALVGLAKAGAREPARKSALAIQQ